MYVYSKKVIHIKIIDALLSLIFPKMCLGCGKHGAYICGKCMDKMPYPEIDENSDMILAAASYEPRLAKKAVRALKYRSARQVSESLAQLIYARLCEDISEINPDALIPAPISGKRRRKRGFNQAEAIAKRLSDMLDVECLTNVLYKNKDTTSQVEIKDKKERLKNLKGAFSVKNPGLVKGKVVIVVDDVSTTGATMIEARRALLRAGAKEVYGVVAAK